MDTITGFFPKIRALFLIFKKDKGSAPPPLVARLKFCFSKLRFLQCELCYIALYNTLLLYLNLHSCNVVLEKSGEKAPILLIAYFLIRFAQKKLTFFIFWNNWVIKENESFLLVEPCSRVTCCVEIKLQYFFRKYIFICTIYTLLMQLISAILYDTC